MTRWTKKRIKEQLSWTNACFRQALLTVYGSQLSNEEKKLDEIDLRALIAERYVIDFPYKGWPQSVNEAYLVNIRGLPTDQIELIVEAYDKGKQYRNYTTIDVLLSELFERAIKPKTRSKI